MNDSNDNRHQDKADIPDSVLNDYLDGELDPATETAIGEALGHDLDLRRRLRALSETVEAVSDLPTTAEPPEAVWADIQRRIGDSSGEPIQLSSVQPLRTQARMSFSWTQLIAAAFVLVVGTGTATWALADGGVSVPETGNINVPTRGIPSVIASVADNLVVPDPGDALPLGEGDLFSRYEETAAELQKLVTEGQEFLDPETVVIVRNSLATIDTALAEARQALEQDPGSEALNRLLLRAMRKKVDLLQGMAAAIQSAA